MKEIYKDIIGYEGLYQVSNLGNVKNLERKVKCTRNGKQALRTVKEKVLKFGKQGRYLRVTLSKNCVRADVSVHRLVAKAFLNIESDFKYLKHGEQMVVDHIDNNPWNNNADNLQLITHRENISKDRKNTNGKYTGVSWHKESEKWRARIGINKKRVCLGLHGTREEARDAYIEAKNKIINGNE